MPDAVANLGTEYKFRVREVCTDTDKTSVYSAISAGVYTHAYCVAGTRVNNTKKVSENFPNKNLVHNTNC